MKKLLSITMLLAFAIAGYAQQEKTVTQFLGIPVDGSKTEMIRKLQAKGFQHTEAAEFRGADLEGEFNGQNVYIVIITNNNKVYRIIVADKNQIDETNIKIRFNRLCNQFTNNPKYISPQDYTILESEDIGYNIRINKKRYEADYFQRPLTSDYEKRSVWFMINEGYLPGTYNILLFYDNEYNHANGEDL